MSPKPSHLLFKPEQLGCQLEGWGQTCEVHCRAVFATAFWLFLAIPCLMVPFPGNRPAGVGAKLGLGTVACGPDPAHSLSSYCLGAKNGFYIFEGL